MTAVEQIQILTKNTDGLVVELIFENVKKEIEHYIKKPYEDALESIAVEMAVIKLNRLGSEGLASQGYSGVSETYLEDYPISILRCLDSHKKKWGMA